MAKKRVEVSKTDDRLITNQIDLDEDEPNFSDPEDFVDDITDEEIAKLTNLTKPTTNRSMDNVVIVDGIPKVKPELFKKLHTFLTKTFSKFGKVTFEKYYKDENEHTTGMVFLEYETSDIANEAIRVLNNHKLDKTHTLLANSYNDIDRFTEENLKELEVPERKTYNKNMDLHTHMLEPDSFDQYALLFADRTVEVWKNSSPDPELLEKRPEWTISYIKWSPRGAFLATLHTKGLALWAGDKFEKFDRYPHERVEMLDFSPSERFLVTYSPVTDPANNNQRVVIWDVVTSVKRRLFDIDSEMISWPMFRWSYKDQYFARIVKDALYIYETKTFSLLDKKPISGIVGLRDFAWSPTDNYIAYWVAELKDVPARVVVVEIPSRTEIAYKNMCNVVECKIHWQKNGDYLCVKVDRFARTKKEKNETKYVGMSYNFEIFHMRTKLIPVDSIVIKETIQDFAFEPTGSKVAIIHGEGQNASVSFYQLKSGSEPSIAKRIDKRGSNHVLWAPNGQFVVVANLSTGTMDFIDTDDYQIMNTREHYQMSQIEWDPTGRYVTSSVSVWKVKTDHGFCIWSFQGKLLRQVNLSDFAQFLWRPRIPSLLSKEKEAEILKNLKKYYSKFESKDRMRTSKASKEIEQKQTEFKQKWHSYATTRSKEVISIKRKRMEMREGYNTSGRYWDYSDKNTISDNPTEVVYKEDEIEWNQ